MSNENKGLRPLNEILPKWEENIFTRVQYMDIANEVCNASLKAGRRGMLMAAIDRAIDDGDVARFEILVKSLNKLDAKELEEA